ncbi:MAG: Gfo/Idh/MocA family oxidoreductase [Clostridia bacterium]|nr:Gfo/Idh/MocA family oxidoreductase [Clostridia bacterium]
MDSKKIYGLALIGCGHIGCQHLEEMYYRDNIRIIGVADASPECAQQAARRFGALRCTTDYRELLTDERVDIVIVATYSSSHLTIVKDCVAHGKHVLCEKPIGVSLAEGEEFVRVVKEAQTKVLVAHILRHNQSYICIRNLIRSGEIGELRVMRMAQNHHAMNWPRYRRLLEDCTPVLDCGVHYLDIAQWITGASICEISGVGTRIEEDSPDLNYTMLNFRMSNGCVGYYEAGWSRNMSSGNLKEFIGTKGHITLQMRDQRSSDREEGDLITVYYSETGEYRSINLDVVYKDMYAQLRTLIDMIENDSPADPDIDSVFSAFRVAVKAQEAIKKGITLRLDATT